jgi:hypothetical protein
LPLLVPLLNLLLYPFAILGSCLLYHEAAGRPCPLSLENDILRHTVQSSGLAAHFRPAGQAPPTLCLAIRHHGRYGKTAFAHKPDRKAFRRAPKG